MARVLLIHPGESVRQELSELLGRSGHEVWFASDGERAKATLQSRPYDLILVATVLPDQNGLRAIPTLAELAGWAPVLVVADPGDPLLDHAEDCGAAGVLELPLRSDQVTVLVDEALSRRAPWDWERRVA